MFLVLYSYSVITVHSLDFVWKTFSTVGKKYMEIVFHFSDFFAHLLWCANIYHNTIFLVLWRGISLDFTRTFSSLTQDSFT